MKAAILVAALLMILMVSKLSAAGKLHKFETKRDFAGFEFAGAKWDGDRGGIVFQTDGARPGDKHPDGYIESPPVEIPFPCDQIVVSWNSETPPGSYLTVYIQARVGGFWSRKFIVGIWNRDNRPVHRMSIRNQKDDMGRMHTDILKLSKPADAFRVSAKFSSLDGETYPTLRLLTVHTLDSKSPPDRVSARRSVWGRELEVPGRSQLSVPDGHRFCSAAATAMVLEYWSGKTERPELNVHLQKAVDGIYDKGWNGTGNWPFNTAYAGEFGGLKAYVTRLRSIAELEKWIEKGVPVISSIEYNRLRNRDTARRSGHLIVVIGLTEDGDIVINDPNTNVERRDFRRVHARKDFEAAWLGSTGSFGTVYLIYPDGWGQ